MTLTPDLPISRLEICCPCLLSGVQEIEPQALSMLGEHLNNWTVSITLEMPGSPPGVPSFISSLANNISTFDPVWDAVYNV